jgi:argininosuccinate lyase
MLRIRDLSSGYGGVPVLRGFSLDLEAGEVLGLLGRNGAGKTTALKTIMGLLAARAGSIAFDGAQLRDLQEAKPPLWVSLDTAKAALAVLTGIVSTLKVNDARMIQAARESYAFAVDLAERLVVEGALSFREAHSVVGRLIREMADSGEKPEQLSGEKVEKVAMATLGKKVSISEDVVRSAVDVNQRIALRNSQGSPHPSEVKKTLEVRGEQIQTARHRLRGHKSALNRARKDLMATVQHYLST